MKEVVGWEEQNSEQHVTGASTLVPSPTTCYQVKEATMNWVMAKNLGVICSKQEGSMVSKMISMEERDKEEARRLGNREGD